MSREMIYFVDIIIIEKVMLYVIAIVNLVLGWFTFIYLFAETDPVADYLYVAMHGSIVLNILSIALLWKGWKNYSHNKKIIAMVLLFLGDSELWFPILSTPHIMDLLWH